MLPVKWRKLSNSLGKKKGFQKIWHELGKETYSANCSVDTWLGSKNIYTCKPVNIKFIYRNRKTLFFILASSRTLPHLIKNWTHGSFSLQDESTSWSADLKRCFWFLLSWEDHTAQFLPMPTFMQWAESLTSMGLLIVRSLQELAVNYAKNLSWKKICIFFLVTFITYRLPD